MSAGHASIDEQFPLTDGRVELVPVAEGMRLRIIDRQPFCSFTVWLRTPGCGTAPEPL
jgi:hypothetical protein